MFNLLVDTPQHIEQHIYQVLVNLSLLHAKNRLDCIWYFKHARHLYKQNQAHIARLGMTIPLASAPALLVYQAIHREYHGDPQHQSSPQQDLSDWVDTCDYAACCTCLWLQTKLFWELDASNVKSCIMHLSMMLVVLAELQCCHALQPYAMQRLIWPQGSLMCYAVHA